MNKNLIYDFLMELDFFCGNVDKDSIESTIQGSIVLVSFNWDENSATQNHQIQLIDLLNFIYNKIK